MSIAVLRFPGTNCEFDMLHSFKLLGVESHLVWHQEKELPKGTHLVVIPGGFSYGDYLRSGAIARFSPIMQAVIRYAKEGGKVLGICNGFQILVESGLLPGALRRNENLHFVSKFQKLAVVSNNNPFLREYAVSETLNIPIAHADGNYFIDAKGLEELKENDQILLTYQGENPNGSIESIAGVCNKEKSVFGLMPHPERAMEPLLGSVDGARMLRGLAC
ncbi:phosphoribosylformylglycinamidine synthase subunit PurQ [Wolinella succinogenes]|uniref:Phosphoribosylformylglycinamidine synthase subunit PurQ n=1 Tax=Wolinella succinogenes (strain ATCC 29543 / DSM 1740 / CCUG 13145 / JCM 31913 / LMG 7466 / NCTC 11488 / FDC 602W) TaxID=273121 RepID=PURQ_WOLSU|nr:phosphoribosylformylglycinamidine synthase subunit PurQ [Wolinella succinogenes]Q7M9X7.1 RecName: Full=Phosphoribosylformylglycinamidine synthase subunit PurQ; Short=FGAM synthase; AltName: Full=Formylglycinamide ribonucleotide amidotransferase subunit I; Short=FGAR amidotransferase I; Short=FGAR-AT I; AltName: Full=Glutaminase PurQ; AltName: Full=Phosphoribosylformylglycinamidine synthase subunit I [Wolinella succinogenes DSM 1740]CAE09736.1 GLYCINAMIDINE SYNTHETASE [Wolinella succinogenes]V